MRRFRLVLELAAPRLVYPSANDPAALGRTPDWAKALVEAGVRAQWDKEGIDAVDHIFVQLSNYLLLRE